MNSAIFHLNNIVLVIFVLVNYSFCSDLAEDKNYELLEVVGILRHGPRAPLNKPYKNDPITEEHWKKIGDGWERLTWVGVEKVYNTGVFFHDRYVVQNKLVDLDEVEKQVYITSTIVKRAEDSGKAFAHGFADKTHLLSPHHIVSKDYKQNVHVQRVSPIKVNVEPYVTHGLYNGSLMRTRDDKKAVNGKANWFPCPHYDEVAIPALHSYVKQTERDMKEVVQHAVNYTGFTSYKKFKDLEGIAYEFDARPELESVSKVDFDSYPAWAKKNDFKDHKYNGKKTFYDIMLEYSYEYQSVMDSAKMGELHTGKLLGDWMSHIQPFLDHIGPNKPTVPKKADGTDKPKLVVYSAHSETQIGLMNLLAVDRKLGCPTAGFFALELYWDKTNKEIVVQMMQYADGHLIALDISQVPPKTVTSLKQFVAEKGLAEKAIRTVEEWNEKCQIPEKKSEATVCQLISQTISDVCSTIKNTFVASETDPKQVFENLKLSTKPAAKSEGAALVANGENE